MAWSSPVQRSTGDLITETIWNAQVDNQTYLGNVHDHNTLVGAGGGGALDWVQEATTTLASAASDITFSTITATYQHLMLIYSLFPAADSDEARLQFNGDTNTNYESSTAGNAAYIPISTDDVGFTAGEGCAGSIIIPEYSATVLGKFLAPSNSSTLTDAVGGTTLAVNGTWQSTAAIVTIKLYFIGGNCEIGSTATLYGLT